jgi:hypothetical protein
MGGTPGLGSADSPIQDSFDTETPVTFLVLRALSVMLVLQ